MWVCPYEDDREHVILHVVNGILLRPYLSGRVWELSPAQMGLLEEGVALYKEIRGEICRSVPFFPLGFADIRTDDVLAYGVQDGDGALLSVITTRTDTAVIPLSFPREIRDISVLYPASGDCGYAFADGLLTVKMPCRAAGRLFRITFA